MRKIVLSIFLFPRHQIISLTCTFQNMRINFSKFIGLEECSLLIFHFKIHQSLSSPSCSEKISGILHHLNEDFLRKERLL